MEEYIIQINDLTAALAFLEELCGDREFSFIPPIALIKLTPEEFEKIRAETEQVKRHGAIFRSIGINGVATVA